jgi:hypothetical protein
MKRRVFPQLALRASRQRRWDGPIGNGDASLAPRGSDTPSQHAGWSGDAGKAGHRDSRAEGVSRDLRVTPNWLTGAIDDNRYGDDTPTVPNKTFGAER